MKKLRIYFPGIDKSVHASLLEDKEPKLVDEIWNTLETPMKAYAHSTLSTGDFVECRPVAPYEMPEFGNQTNPLGEDIPYLCDMKAGEIFWAGWYFGFIYGRCTEPMVAMGPTVALVDEDDIETFKQAGLNLWNHVYLYHKIGLIEVYREEA